MFTAIAKFNDPKPGLVGIWIIKLASDKSMLLSPAFSGPNKKPIFLYLYFSIINLIASLGVSIFFF